MNFFCLGSEFFRFEYGPTSQFTFCHRKQETIHLGKQSRIKLNFGPHFANLVEFDQADRHSNSLHWVAL